MSYLIAEIKEIFPSTNKTLEALCVSIDEDKNISDKNRKYLDSLIDSIRKTKSEYKEKLDSITYENAAMVGLEAMAQMSEVYDEILETQTSLGEAYSLALKEDS